MFWFIIQLFHLEQYVEQYNHSHPTDGTYSLRGSAHTNTFLPQAQRSIFTAVIFEQYLDKCVLCPCGSSAEKKTKG